MALFDPLFGSAARAVSMALASHIGKSAARALVEEASRQVRDSGKHLREVPAQNRAVTERLTSAELDRLFAPENYPEAPPKSGWIVSSMAAASPVASIRKERHRGRASYAVYRGWRTADALRARG
jgi:hypothetical protein